MLWHLRLVPDLRAGEIVAEVGYDTGACVKNKKNIPA